jgi:hypothetical protein
MHCHSGINLMMKQQRFPAMGLSRDHLGPSIAEGNFSVPRAGCRSPQDRKTIFMLLRSFRLSLLRSALNPYHGSRIVPDTPPASF